MANLRTSLAHVGTSDRHDVVVPAHVFARKLQERADRQKRASATIIASASEKVSAP